MDNENGPPKPSKQSDPGVRFGPGIVEKVLSVIQGILLVILFMVALIALFPMTFNNLFRGG